MQRILLGIGTGRCGTASLAGVLDRQLGFSVSHEAWPVLPWRVVAQTGGDSPGETIDEAAARVIAARFERLRRERAGVAVVGDVASFYLPYLPAALEIEPGLVVICLRRPRDEVIASFEAWCDRVFPLAVDSWTRSPGPGRHHDPVWTQIMPHYDEPTRADGLRRYWDEYDADEPGRLRVAAHDGPGR